MFPAIGLVIVLVSVFVTYIVEGGKIDVVLEALPGEIATIFGAGLGAFIIANKPVVLKKSIGTLKLAVLGSKIHSHEYKDMLCLLYLLCKLIRSKGYIALEQHIENPKESGLFNQFPSVLANDFAAHLICDSLRTMSMGVENPHQVEEMIGKNLEKFHHERSTPAHSITSMADGLPAIGIVAAVLGVIKTMASIDQPPAILGRMIGSALCGTFLGVFLSYCLVGPLGQKAQQVIDEEQQYYIIIRDVLVAHLNGAAPSVAMELGRGNIPSYYQPTFLEMEQVTGDLKPEGGFQHGAAAA